MMVYVSRRRPARVLCRYLLFPLIKVLLLAWLASSVGSVSADELTAEAIWQRIEPFFSPPPEMVDDFGDYRPGLAAVEELGIRSPLSEAGLHKEEIRQLSRRLGLSTWDKPAFACLASRVPYGYEITAEKLKQIDEGEIYLRQLGICQQVRVRHHGAVARIEVDPQAIHRFLEKETRYQITEFFKNLGFQYVALDIEGYAMGSLNREIAPKEGNPNG